MRALCLLLLAACASETLDERAPADYATDPSWSLRITSGATPGHGDTIRYIYANSIAQQYTGGYYDVGSILVKEIYTNDGGERGALQVIETMHRPADAETDYANRLGWVFGAASTPGGEETEHNDFCWRRCHANAPIAGAWFDYSQN